MKKLSICFSFIFFILTTPVMAATIDQVVTTQSIAAALDARGAMLRAKTTTLPSSTKAEVAESLVSTDTYIVVINYTNDPIVAVFPARPVLITGRTAARYERYNYMGLSYIELQNINNVPFWSGYVQYHDIISVYISNGHYVVYDTH
jgi:hypothetical protein